MRGRHCVISSSLILSSLILSSQAVLVACAQLSVSKSAVSVAVDPRSEGHYLTTEPLEGLGTEPNSLRALSFWWSEARPDKLVITVASSAGHRVEALALFANSTPHRLKIATDLYRPETEGLERNPFLPAQPGRYVRHFPVNEAIARELRQASQLQLTLQYPGDAAEIIHVSDDGLKRLQQQLRALDTARQDLTAAQ